MANTLFSILVPSAWPSRRLDSEHAHPLPQHGAPRVRMTRPWLSEVAARKATELHARARAESDDILTTSQAAILSRGPAAHASISEWGISRESAVCTTLCRGLDAGATSPEREAWRSWHEAPAPLPCSLPVAVHNFPKAASYCDVFQEMDVV